MKKHQFLDIELTSSVSMTRQEGKFLELASEALTKVIKAAPGTKLSVSLLICGDSKIKKLNADHRSKNKVTDVLSFPAQENLRNLKLSGQVFLGDIALCLPQARRQAKAFKVSVADEVIHLFFHGILHLMGYDHEISAKEEKLMQTLEDKLIAAVSTLKKAK